MDMCVTTVIVISRVFRPLLMFPLIRGFYYELYGIAEEILIFIAIIDLIATFTGCSQWGGPNNLFVNISPYPSGSVSAWASFDAISVSTDPGYTPGISGNRSTFLSTTYVLNATNCTMVHLI